MDVRQANLILTILAEGSVTAAAQKLYISQPALSQSLKNLEREIGTQIFIRGSLPIKPSYAGEKVIETARKVIALDNNLQFEIRDIKEERAGVFRFGLSHGIRSDLLTTIVPTYLRDFPYVNLKILETGSAVVEQSILDGKIDVGLVRNSGPNKKELEYTLIDSDRLVLIAGKDSAFARNHPEDEAIDFTQLRDEVFVVKRQGSRSRYVFDQMCQTYQIYPKIFFEFDGFTTASQITLDCGCVSLTSLSTVLQSDLCSRFGARCFFLKDINDRHDLFICHRRDVNITYYMRYWVEMIQKFFQDCEPYVFKQG